MDPLLGSALIAGGTSLFNAIFGTANQSSAQSFNAEEAEKQRNWQSGENVLNRDYVSQENKLSRDWQSAESQRAREWEEQMYNLYNSPSAMMRQYKEAHVNPFLSQVAKLGEGMGTASPMSGAPAQSSPSMVSGSPAQFSSFYHPTLASDFASLIGVDAQAGNQRSMEVKNVVQAAKEAYDIGGSDYAQQILDSYLPKGADVKSSPYVQSFMLEVKRQELEIELFDFRSQIEQRWGAQKAEKAMEILDRESDKLLSEIDKIGSDIHVNEASANELLTRSARNVAEKAHLSADTATINGIRKALIKSADAKADMDFFESQEASAEYDLNTDVRIYKRTANARRKRYEAETPQNPKYNKRSAAIRNFTRNIQGLENYTPRTSINLK